MQLDISSFDTARVTDMSRMFKDCKRLRSLDLSGFDTARVTDMSGMFSGCAKLNKWTIPESWPVEAADAVPEPTAEHQAWRSQRDETWMSLDDIRSRGRMADTFEG